MEGRGRVLRLCWGPPSPPLLHLSARTPEPPFLQGGAGRETESQGGGPCIAAATPTHTPTHGVQPSGGPQSAGRPAVCFGDSATPPWTTISLSVKWGLHRRKGKEGPLWATSMPSSPEIRPLTAQSDQPPSYWCFPFCSGELPRRLLGVPWRNLGLRGRQEGFLGSCTLRDGRNREGCSGWKTAHAGAWRKSTAVWLQVDVEEPGLTLRALGSHGRYWSRGGMESNQ